jgi:YVTN family beta-propeller protein
MVPAPRHAAVAPAEYDLPVPRGLIFMRCIRLLTALAVAATAGCGHSDPAVPQTTGLVGKCGTPLPATATVRIANSGRKLAPLGRMTTVGDFPTGGRLSPDGRFYWSVSAGHGRNDVQIVDVASGAVAQVLPLPGSYGQMAFSADGARAYVSGTPIGGSVPTGPTRGDGGDVVHVFDVDASGHAVEVDPFALPSTTGGSGRLNGFPPDPTLPNSPAGLAVSPDGQKLVVALYNADRAVIIDTASGATSTVDVGAYPFAVGFERSGRYAYVSNAYDGSLTRIDVVAGVPTATITGLGGPAGDRNSQPQYVLGDPTRDVVYVAVTNHDGVAIVDTATDRVLHYVDLKLAAGYGAQPVALALSPDAATLYVADAGENAVVAIALADRADGSARAFDVIGKLPTADYTTDVAVTLDGCTLIWQAGRGIGTGANPLYTSSHGYPAVNNDTSPDVSPYPSYIADLLIGRVGVLPAPTDAGFAQLTPLVDAAQQPENARAAPADTPVTGPGGGASDKIKYVFYVVKENRTYDQIFGSDRRGAGDPTLQVLEDNCGESNTQFQGADRNHPGCGITPNQHALSRDFVLLDNFYEDSEVSVDGHAITTGAYATNYSLKSMHQDYSGRTRPANEVGVFPVTFPPKHFLFDQAATQGITFRNYGELSGGAAPGVSNDGRLTYLQVIANSDTAVYPNNLFNGCVNNTNAPNNPTCAFDCGLGCKSAAPLALSRIDAFNLQFQAQLLTGTVPHFNYLIMMSDHTNGVGDGARDPLAMCADNDLGVGQLVQLLSASSIWPQTVVFVVEDDAQDGADHIDAHRAPAIVAGPYVKRGGSVVHTRYDQLSVIRTMELILGLEPLSVFDAVATPMYDVFTPTPDLTPYAAIQPEKDLLAVCPCAPEGNGAAGQALARANAALSDALPYSQVDRVPQSINDRLLWQRVFGTRLPVPRSGPNASRREQARAQAALATFERYRKNPRDAREELGELLTGDDDD